ncbi:MAG: SUMF1/EgtB/PvdO family nonheme iron enzyme [Planctomycetes bacterium]|nr:SUMF1/EgtB/PvdO family nonheme iron enzyme [Planctomycetota bacterium]
MKRRTAILILCFLSVSFLLFAQESERRTALVIGNSDYRSSPLKNPVNDARDLSQALGELGFAVTTKLNSSHKEIFEAVRDFGKELARGGVGLFFYAGHAVEVGGTNYLIPLDADIQAEDEVRFASIDAGLVLSKMESAGNSTNILILDACRDNPFKKSFRSSSRGLAVVQAPRGSLVIYATAPGSVAADGKGRNGIFTGSLLHHIKVPGIEVREMLTRVRREVMAATGGEQIPWDSSSLTAGFYFAGTLYLDGSEQVRIPAEGIARVTDLETSRHRLEMRYDDGEKETKRVMVVKDRAVQVAFTYIERPKVPVGFVLLEAGTFRMGSTGGESDEKPVHTVRISRHFYMSKYEVTVGGFRRFVNDTGYKTTADREGGVWIWTGSEWENKADANWRNPYFNQGEDNPVVCVSWYDAVEYCNWLSGKEGLTPAYRIKGEEVQWNVLANGYRLPTEAEWEYAARGGNRSRGYTYAGATQRGM